MRGGAAAVSLPRTLIALVYSQFELIKKNRKCKLQIFYFLKACKFTVYFEYIFFCFLKIAPPGCANEPSCYSEDTMACALASPA
jgi:hypothetical protein